jgi:hypothetical protein
MAMPALWAQSTGDQLLKQFSDDEPGLRVEVGKN